MDGQQLVGQEALHLLPAEAAVLGQRIGIADGTVAHAVMVDIIVVGDHQVRLAGFQRVQEAHEVFGNAVVAVHHLEEFSGGVLQALVDAGAVTAVFLMDDPDDVGIFCGIFIADFPGIVPGAVVDDDDLHPVAALQEAFDTVAHVRLGIIARDCYSQKFHIVTPFWFFFPVNSTIYPKICQQQHILLQYENEKHFHIDIFHKRSII